MSTLPGAAPTLRDVAAVAGVSYRTVSRVANAEPYVSPEVVIRVQAAMEQLGFQPNDVARGLRGGRTRTIGLVIEDIRNPFYSALTSIVEQVARAHGYMLVTLSCEDDPGRERDLVEWLLRKRVDGLLIVPASRDHSYLAAAVERGMPVVFVDRPPENLAVDSFVGDNSAGVRAGVGHLIRHGHTRIACVLEDLSLRTARERLAGYEQAMAEHGLEVTPDLVVTGVRGREAARDAVAGLMAQGMPTALFTGNNRITVGALEALGPARKSTALVGFGDFELADVVEPAVTVVSFDVNALAHPAATQIFRRLDGDAPAQVARIVVPTRLTPRGSGEIRPGRAATGRSR